MSVVTRIEVIEFEYDLLDRRYHPNLVAITYAPGQHHMARSRAIRIHSDEGVTGEYVGGSAAEYAGVPVLAQALLGRSALERERLYNDAKQMLRATARLGLGVVDIALWDLAGKQYGVPIHELLGGQSRPLPCYASTYIGDREEGGLNSPEAFADFAEQCYELGFRAYKIHPWPDSSTEEMIAAVRAVGERVGDRMSLMLDPYCSLQTFSDAVRVGRACDEFNFIWLEDPFRDGGVSSQAHRKLRELIRTPLLQLEHVRGLEAHVDFIVSGGTDFVRADPDYDGGVTGVMKIAHAAEGFGLDVELHGPDPIRRQLMTSILNTNYYELGLVHPKVGPQTAPIYLGDYRDDLHSVDETGCVFAPQGPGSGVEYDWDYIYENRVGGAEYSQK